MTENEVKSKLDSLHYKIIHTSFCNKVYESEIEALCLAKDVLQEIQQYRAIGTVEGYERAVESATENYKLYREYRTKVQNFEVIGTIEEFKVLKEKNEPKKVVVEHIPKTSWTKEISHYLCPSCRSIFSFGGKPYCSNCGQKIDWQ